MSTTTLTLSVAEAAARLGVHPETVYTRIRDKEWPCTRMGRKIRFTPAQLDQILALCEQPAISQRKPRQRKAG
jgi:excisionase family DNA binding protein